MHTSRMQEAEEIVTGGADVNFVELLNHQQAARTWKKEAIGPPREIGTRVSNLLMFSVHGKISKNS